jgi:hypothetical protein
MLPPSKTMPSPPARTSPARLPRNVDLPAPLAPMMATTSPAAISKSMPYSAWKSP